MIASWSRRGSERPIEAALWAEHPAVVASIVTEHVGNGQKPQRCVVCTTSAGGHVRWPCSLRRAADEAQALIDERAAR